MERVNRLNIFLIFVKFLRASRVFKNTINLALYCLVRVSCDIIKTLCKDFLSMNKAFIANSARDNSFRHFIRKIIFLEVSTLHRVGQHLPEGDNIKRVLRYLIKVHVCSSLLGWLGYDILECILDK